MSTKAFLWLLAGVLVLGIGLGLAMVGLAAQGGDDGTAAVSNTVQSAPQNNGRQSQGQPAPEDGAASSGSQTAPTQTPEQEPQDQADQGNEDDAQPTQGQQLSQEDLADLRQRIQAGQVTQDELAELRQRFQRQPGQAAGAGFPGGGLTGTVASVQGNLVTIETPQGPSQATVGVDTNIQKTDRGALEDLVVGVRVTVVGQRGADGTVQASTISILPEGSEGFGGGGLAGRFGQRQLGGSQGGQQFGQGQDGQGQSNRGQFGGAPGGQDLAGGPVLTGTIESVDGNVLTVNTPQGPLPVTVGTETNIQKTAQGSLDDLQTGFQVTVIGQTREDGTVQAGFIVVAPEGFPGGRGLPGRGFGGTQQQP